MNKNKDISSLKRKLAGSINYETEIKNITESLNKKNQEILELKNVTFQKNDLLIELEALKN